MKIQLKPDVLPLILHTVFVHSNESIELVKAVETLNKDGDGLDEAFLKLAFETPKYSDQVATALMTLKKEQNYNATTKKYVCSSPKYASGLAQFLVQLSKAECSSPVPRMAMLEHPKSASLASKVIEFLQQYELHDEKNIIAICNAGLTGGALLNLLDVMQKANLLDQTNFDKLLPRLSFIKTLYSGVKCLANSEKLDLFNFDTLISDPINAVSLAENLGGKSNPSTCTFFKDSGAQDFVTIRRNAKILWQGQRQGVFFPAMPPEKQQSFEKYTGKRLTTAQMEILVKIARYSGNQTLEEKTEHNIAQNAILQFLNPVK